MSRTVPALDESQDWMLVYGGVEKGHTILEFKRHLTTCDDNDIDITVSRNISIFRVKLLVILLLILDKHFQRIVEHWGYKTFKSYIIL